MAVKYMCPKCGRRFAEWGAEKHGFKCPGDEWCPKDRPDDIELVRVGMQEDKPAKKPTLKRPVKRSVVAAAAMDEDEILVPDIEDVEAHDEVEAEEFDEVEGEEEEEFVAAPDEDVVGEPAVAVVVDEEIVDEDEDLVEGDGEIVVDETLEDAEDIVDDTWKD
ncbi:MAG: C2HC-type zinc finger protein [Candidatus Hydrogenedentes bacterium]|nr:C2HC-type zinc finger protein [Candidatus Hydrogenedentota bacterium]